MLVAFLDESYSKDHYCIAAFVIDQVHLNQLDEAIHRAMQYAAGFGVQLGTELHAHKLMGGSNGWEPVRGKHRAAIAIYQNALNEIAGLPGKMVVRGVDVGRLHARYRYPSPPHKIALQHVLEDLNEYAEKLGQRVSVVADRIADETSHQQQVAAYQVDGTPGYKPNKLARIDLPIHFQDSHTVAGLQVADLIAYLYHRHEAHVETNPKTAVAVGRLWSTLQPVWATVWTWRP